MNLVPDSILLVYVDCRQMARAVVPLNFNAFLEKAKLKDIVRNDADQVRSPRSVLTATQKAYVFDAPLDVQTPTMSSVNVMNT